MPVLLFFLAFKFYGIYVATVVGIIATSIQVVLTRFFKGYWDKVQLLTLAVFTVFGSMTLYFHDPIFVKWKPTVIFWIFGIVIFASQWVTHKPIMQRLMEKSLTEKGAIINPSVWKTLNIMWTLFFILLGGVNLYVAYHFSNDVWVNFKFYGITIALMVFSVFQALYLMRHISEPKS
jgi:intracellular septation protein